MTETGKTVLTYRDEDFLLRVSDWLQDYTLPLLRRTLRPR